MLDMELLRHETDITMFNKHKLAYDNCSRQLMANAQGSL